MDEKTAEQAVETKPERGFCEGEHVVLRPVREADLPELARLLAENPYEREPLPWTHQRLKQKFEDKEKPGLWEDEKRIFAIARKSGGLVGFVRENQDWSPTICWNAMHVDQAAPDRDAVIAARDVDTIYEVPLAFHDQGLDESIVKLLGLPARPIDLSRWEEIVRRVKAPRRRCRIGVVGKYIEVKDSYKSLNEALAHGGIANEARVKIVFTDSEKIEKEGIGEKFKDVDGILVPGGFGNRGIEGKIQAIQYARTHKVPYFGICLGMQVAVIEYARNVAGMKKANSTEFDPESPYPVIDFLPEQRHITDKGASMRLGSYPCVLDSKSFAFSAYCDKEIDERHRHRYEFNNDYLERMERGGLRFSGICPQNGLVEVLELSDHPWFVAVQFHPEFKSKPLRPHPLFAGFVGASYRHKVAHAHARSEAGTAVL